MDDGPMFTCPSCDGTGWRLWMDRGRPSFLRCIICAGKRTIMWVYGAAPRPTLIPENLQGGSIVGNLRNG